MLLLRLIATRTFRITWLFTARFRRLRMSVATTPPPNTKTPGTPIPGPPETPPAAGPHSVASRPVGAMLNGPSVLFSRDASV